MWLQLGPRWPAWKEVILFGMTAVVFYMVPPIAPFPKPALRGSDKASNPIFGERLVLSKTAQNSSVIYI